MSKIIQYYHNINSIISEKTKQKRQQIKSLQDEFMTFSWGGYDAFENFGAFIINDKNGSLKFYNGPGFSNEYSKPQFDSSAGDLQGVNFDKQTISFTIGVYWISIEHYRLMLNWLNPLETNYLIFGFNPDFRYNVKLSKIGDSTRWIVGREEDKPMYYTEISLIFELQGVPCAKGTNSYEFKKWADRSSDSETILYTSINNTKDFIESDLPTPLDISIPFILQDNGDINTNFIYHIELDAVYTDIENNKESISLFNVELKNLTILPIDSSDIPLNLNIRYNSEIGLLFLTYGNSDEKILSLLNLNDSGEKIVDNYAVNKFSLPGRFEYPSFDTTRLEIKLSLWKYDSEGSENNKVKINPNFTQNLLNNFPFVICYPRTNIL